MTIPQIPSHLTDALKTLARVAADGGQRSVRALIERDPRICTLEHAGAARALLEVCKLERNLEATFNLSLVTFCLYDALGRPIEMMESTLPNLELGFDVAESGPEYLKIAESA